MNNNEQNTDRRENNDIKANITKCDFPGLHQMMVTTSIQLCTDLNQIFYNVFSDYNGMTINQDQMPTGGIALYATLFFLPGSRHKTASASTVEATQIINQINTNANLVERQLAMSRMSRQAKQFRLTDQARKFLASYICDFKINHSNQPKKLVERVRWNECEIEQVDQVQQTYLRQPIQQTYLTLKYISLEKILSSIYGKTNENGNPIQYQVQVATQLPNVIGGIQQNNKLLTVAMVDVEQVNTLIEKLGVRPQISNFGIIR